MLLSEKRNATPGYLALVQATGVVNLSDRTQIELTGNDRGAFLHNFCTNAIRNLQPGQGTEAFILDVKGHILGHVYVFVSPHSIVLDTVAGQAGRLIEHLDRYLIREDVTIRDRTSDWSDLLVAGAQAADLMESLALHVPEQPLAHGVSALMGHTLFIRRVDLVGPDSFLIACQRENAPEVIYALVNAGAVAADQAEFEVARIEAGTPLYGVDITDKNLPQEVNRDRQTISFTKGCYLGQETVARIDALGHVNKLLVGVRFAAGDVPPPGGELNVDAAVVGTVTSSTFSPRLECPLALAYVRRGHTAHGTKLTSPLGPAEVVALPL